MYTVSRVDYPLQPDAVDVKSIIWSNAFGLSCSYIHQHFDWPCVP